MLPKRMRFEVQPKHYFYVAIFAFLNGFIGMLLHASSWVIFGAFFCGVGCLMQYIRLGYKLKKNH
jgi:hypothetical protein